MGKLEDLRAFVETYPSPPDLSQMPRKTLADKGINGPTSAHFIEEIHTPHNLAYITATTGSTAFQNIVGVTPQELPRKIAAGMKALELAGLKAGDRLLITYPPLVNVFAKEGLAQFGCQWDFLLRSSRDALILALCQGKYKAVLGESSFLRAALADAKKMDMAHLLPPGLIFIAAGTPLDMELPVMAEKLVGGQVHDLYGCQEFGWLTMDGIELREDISLIPAGDKHWDLIVGGLPTGDRFPIGDQGHLLNPMGKVITYQRKRTAPDIEVTVLRTTAASDETIHRLARTILRIKARIVRVGEGMETGGANTLLALRPYDGKAAAVFIEGPEKTRLMDDLLTAQLHYQSQSQAYNKKDPAWIKDR